VGEQLKQQALARADILLELGGVVRLPGVIARATALGGVDPIGVAHEREVVRGVADLAQQIVKVVIEPLREQEADRKQIVPALTLRTR